MNDFSSALRLAFQLIGGLDPELRTIIGRGQTILLKRERIKRITIPEASIDTPPTSRLTSNPDAPEPLLNQAPSVSKTPMDRQPACLDLLGQLEKEVGK